MRPKRSRSSGSTSANGILHLHRGPAVVGLVEADLPAASACFDDLLQPVEGATADEQNVLRVDLDVFLLRVLAAALRRHGSNGALENLQERLLHALARHVARDARVLGLPRDLVDFVDVDDSALALGDVEVARPGGDGTRMFLDVLTHIARFGERGGVRDGEGDVENACKCSEPEGFCLRPSGR
jgi:hypothetical protein